MKRQLAVLFASAAMLAACGGGGGDDPAPAPVPPPAPAPAPVGMVPDSVNASIANFIGYLASLVTVSDDTTEPLDVSAVNPPLSETAEVTALP
jgi:hypothetical protein